jgi:hypothetical protein
VPAQDIVAKFLATFREFPPSQKTGSFSLDKVMALLSAGSGQAPPPTQATQAATAPQKEPEVAK